MHHNEFKGSIAGNMEHLVLSCLESRLEGNGSIYGRFLLGPFKIGHGTTVATALRRTLLSELQGIAITAVGIKGATHQYSSLAGVRESTLDIVLNLKQVVLTGEIRNGLPAVGYLHVQGPQTAKASDLKLPDGIRCVDGDQHLASVSANGLLTMKFVVSAGKNYVSSHSPSAQVLTPSVFQPRMREGSLTPLALRGIGKPLGSLTGFTGPAEARRSAALHRDAAEGTRGRWSPSLHHPASEGAVVRNSPQDRRQAQEVLTHRGASSRLSSTIEDVVVYNTARRGASLSALKELVSPPVALPRQPMHGGDRATSEPSAWSPYALPRFARNEPPLHLPPSHTTEPKRSSTADAQEGVNPQRGLRAPITKGTPQDSGRMTADRQGLIDLVHRGRQWERDSSLLPIDAVFMPVRKVNFSLQIDDQWQEPRERVILEIWTNGSIHPRQAINEAATCLVHLFSLLRQADARPGVASLLPDRPHWGSMALRARSTTTPSGRRARAEQGQRGGGSSNNGDPGQAALEVGGAESPSGEGANLTDRAGPMGGGLTGQGSVARGADGILPHALGDGGKANSIDIGDLDLSVQAYTALKRTGVDTLGDLVSFADDQVWDEGIVDASISNEIHASIKRLVLE